MFLLQLVRRTWRLGQDTISSRRRFPRESTMALFAALFTLRCGVLPFPRLEAKPHCVVRVVLPDATGNSLGKDESDSPSFILETSLLWCRTAKGRPSRRETMIRL